MELSKRISSIAPSATLAITARAKQMQASGIDVVDFGVGEPDFDTPAFIKSAAKAAMDAGDTKYTARAKTKLIEAIVGKLAKENNIHVEPAQVIVTFGGKHALYAAFQALIDPGDKVLLPCPYWVSYPEQVRLASGASVILHAGREQNFKITPTQLLKAAKGAKIFVLNSPSNPTGIAYTPDELFELAKAVLMTDLIVFSDEIYEKLVYGGVKFVSFAALDKRLPERTITFNGLSKPFAMTGWRLGWAAGPKDVISAMKNLMSHETSDTVSFAQAGALEAYSSPQAAETIEAMRQEFEKRGTHMARRLNALPGVRCVEPTGAFYCFPDVSAHYGKTIAGIHVGGSLSFTRAALEAANVALVPGDAFGEDRCVRLSFATGMDQIDKGIDRLAKMLA